MWNLCIKSCFTFLTRIFHSIIIFCTMVFMSSVAWAQSGLPALDSLSIQLQEVKPKCGYQCIQDTIGINIMLSLASGYDRIDLDSAIFYAQMAIECSSKIHWKKGMAKGQMYLGDQFDNQRDTTNARLKYQESLRIWRPIAEDMDGYDQVLAKTQIASLYNRLGNVYMAMNDVQNALDYFYRSIALYDSLKMDVPKMKPLTNIGSFYISMNAFELAMNALMQALSIAEVKGSDQDKLDIYEAIGKALNDKSDHEGAMKYFSHALDLSRKLGKKHDMGICHFNLGNVYLGLGDYEKALDHASQAMTIFGEFGDQHGLIVGGMTEGLAHIALNEYPEAVDALSKVWQNTSDYPTSDLLIRLNAGLGDAWMGQGNLTKSGEFFKAAAAISDTLGNLAMIAFAHEKLSEWYEKTGDLEKAYFHADKASKSKDTYYAEIEKAGVTRKLLFFERERERAVLKAEQEKTEAVRVEENKRQRLIRNISIGASIITALLVLLGAWIYKIKRDRNERQRLTEQQLETAKIEMKALRAQMNPHFIFNALQSIQNFLLNNETHRASEHLVKFSKLIRSILENSRYSEIPLEEELMALEIYMQLESIRLKHPFEYKIDLGTSVSSENELIPPLILQPFVENAIWHGLQYKDGLGKIRIEIQKVGNMLRCIIEDNGVGRGGKTSDILNHNQKRQSLGSILTEERLRIHNAMHNTNAEYIIEDLTDKDNRPSGTRVILSLPSTIDAN